MRVFVTGSAGLIGSETVRFYCERGATVVGIDNDSRRMFFGEAASTAATAQMLAETYDKYQHLSIDIRDEEALRGIFREAPFDLVVHAAAQPSHDWAAKNPALDFSINAMGALRILEGVRLHSPEAVVVMLSTNKVYGDQVNDLPLLELPTRFDLQENHPLFHGIDESMGIDHTTHSIYGASKVSADVLTQEYGRYFGIKTCAFRCGCITGGAHAGVKEHGFLAHLVRSVSEERTYDVIGYRGKQVRDNLHAHDIAAAIEAFRSNPRKGAVYNLGGGRERSVSILEALDLAGRVTGKKPIVNIVARERKGDHKWYITSTKSLERDYPSWKPTTSLEKMMEEIARKNRRR